MGVLGKSNFKSRAAFLFPFPLYQFIFLSSRAVFQVNIPEKTKRKQDILAHLVAFFISSFQPPSFLGDR